MSHLMLAAAHKSSGKTTVSIGLCAALTQRGLTVQPFKKGPDYIDPLWLTQAARRDCHNLDFHMMSEAEIQQCIAQYTHDADIGMIEGNMGLFDSIDVEGKTSNAALAQLVGAPVILVLNPHGMTRSIVPIILGFQAFDKNINIAGIILNHVASQRHETKLLNAIAYYTNIPVLGSIRRSADLNIEERHLGLIPSNEAHRTTEKINQIASIIEQQVDLDKVLEIGQLATKFEYQPAVKITSSAKTLKIGIMRDNVFGFYYASDLQALQNAGAELVFINALQDIQLPKLDGLFIGGGFPETHAEQLASNTNLKQSIKHAIEQGLPVYAECGGLMYLARQLTWNDKTWDMVGALPLDTVMNQKPKGSGYTILQETGHGLWPLYTEQGELGEIAAHEFHYSQAINVDESINYAYQVKRGYGIDGQYDGIVYKNTLACYAHLKDVDKNHWAQRFINFIRKEDKHV
ncbi:cobyrinate a,c-diamide synthase [Candidatus Albibeggiatoa sp. nov. NOAA]|uniref:cobyrinate a,c-diamide synthase n=1 Tax=Candidatus Albibeggiatoa sp. nov. NOAA TaxID=3162724 RepID=UPI0032FAE367|nr:hydrogenobyrinic acid a,c-diamide synthase (glutamine-hydrolyzing) [Thiotrichaceae bacterium]